MKSEIKNIIAELRDRGLEKEAGFLASTLKKVGADTIIAHEPSLLTETSNFIDKYLNPSKSKDPATEEVVEDMLHNNSVELRDYIIEFLSGVIYDKALAANVSAQDFYEHLVDEIRFDERFESDDDFTFLSKAFMHYLNDYAF